MDEGRDDISDDEFHDCLEDMSDTKAANLIKDFKNPSTVCSGHSHNRLGSKECHSGNVKGDTQVNSCAEGTEKLCEAKAEYHIQGKTRDKSSNGNSDTSNFTTHDSLLKQSEAQHVSLKSVDGDGKQELLGDGKIETETPPNNELVEELLAQHVDKGKSESVTETSPDDKSMEDPVSNENAAEQSNSKSTSHDNDREESSDESEDESHLTATEIEGRTSEAKQLKIEGNDAYNKENFEDAIRLYSEGIKICPKCSQKDCAILYSNRSACYAKMDRTDDAIQDCTSAISLHPQYLKVYLRRAQLYDKTEKYEEAAKDYEKILEIDPSIHSARKALMSMPEKIELRNEKLKQQMMSSLKDLGNLFLRPFGLSTDNFQMQQNPDSGSYNIQFNNNPGS